MNFILAYISALEEAQLEGSKKVCEKIIVKSADRSLDIYLKAAKGESTHQDIDRDDLLKIGELAKAVEETVVTVRYWSKEGLLDVAKINGSGYHLYGSERIQRCEYIKQLKKDRLTIAEIKEKIISVKF